MNAQLISPFQVQQELQHRARDVYAVGFNAGEAAERLARKKAVDVALGVGFCIGVGAGVIFALAALRWLA